MAGLAVYKIGLWILANMPWLCLGIFFVIAAAYEKSKDEDYWLD